MTTYSPTDRAGNIFGKLRTDADGPINLGELTLPISDETIENAIHDLDQLRELMKASEQRQASLKLAIAIIQSGAFNRDDTTMTGERYGEAIVSAVQTIQEGLDDEANLE